MTRVLIAIFSIFLLSVSHASSMHQIKQSLQDSLITTKIKAKYTSAQDINPLKVSVATKNSIVTLKGNVATPKAYYHALRIARNTKGVNAVNSTKLRVKQVNLRLTDAYITTKVEAIILKMKITRDRSIPLVDIGAHTKNGVVTLTGSVKHKASIHAIINNVAKVHGVKQVVSNLKVKRS